MYIEARIINADCFDLSSFSKKQVKEGLFAVNGKLKDTGNTTIHAYEFDADMYTKKEVNNWLDKQRIKTTSIELTRNVVINQLNEDEAEILIYGGIGARIDGDYVAEQIKYLVECGCKKIHERINTSGGNVFNGFSIVSANIFSDAEIHTYNDGLAASMGAVILVSGDVVHAVDYSLTMIHAASLGGLKEEELEKGDEKDMMIRTNKALLTLLHNRTGIPKQELLDMMSKDTWMTALEAKNKGFVHNIIPSKKKPKSKQPQDIFKYVTNQYINADLIKKQNEMSLEKICNLLDTSEDNAVERVKEMVKNNKLLTSEKEDLATKLTESNDELTASKEELDQVKAEKETLETENKAYKDKEAETQKAEIEQVVDQAILDGRFDAKDKEAIIEKFKDDIEGLQKIIGSIPKPGASISKEIDNKAGEEERKDWGFAEWSKNDPVGLQKIKETDKALYNELGHKSFGDKWKDED